MTKFYLIGILAFLTQSVPSVFCQSIVSKDWVYYDQEPFSNIYVRVDPYFVNQNIGFIFGSYSQFQYTPQTKMFRTTDAGKKWTYISFFDDNASIVQQIYFVALNRGFAATSTGIYETNDSGSTWRKISHDGIPYNSVYAADRKIYAYAFDRSRDPMYSFSAPSLWGALIVSDDDGNHWDTLFAATPYKSYWAYPTTLPLILGNKENVVYSQTADANGNLLLVYSTNNGKDWSSNILDSSLPVSPDDKRLYGVAAKDRFTYGLYCLPHCKDIFRIPTPTTDSVEIIDTTPIMRSVDFGKTWDTVARPIEIGGWIAGNSCAMYVSNAANFNPTNGVYRSTDKGHTWSWLNFTFPDFTEWDDHGNNLNLSVVGGGAILYAGDIYGKLCRTNDGGDGTLSAAALTSRLKISQTLSSGGKDTLVGSICDPLSATVIIENLSCNYAVMDSTTIEGLDTSEYSMELIHHYACDELPDTLIIRINTSFIGTRRVGIHSNFINDEFETIDSTLSFILITTEGSKTEANVYIKPEQIAGQAGDTLDIPLFINSTQSTVYPGATMVSLTYLLNTNFLMPFAFIPIKGVITDSLQTTKTTAMITLQFDPVFFFTGETILGRLRCVPYVTDTLETDITLNGISYSSGCLTTLADSNTMHFTLKGCGALTLYDFMKFGLSYDILSIIPNPAATSVQVELRNNGSLLHYQLLDALGVAYRTGTTTGNFLQLNLSGLSSGNYYFRLKGESETPVTKTLLIVR